MQGEGGLTCCQGACDLCKNLQSCWAASSMVGPTHRSNEPPPLFLEMHVCVYPETRQEGRALNRVHCPLTILYVLPDKETVTQLLAATEKEGTSACNCLDEPHKCNLHRRSRHRGDALRGFIPVKVQPRPSSPVVMESG